MSYVEYITFIFIHVNNKINEQFPTLNLYKVYFSKFMPVPYPYHTGICCLERGHF